MLNVVPITDVTADDQPTFADFWLLYPKRVARLDAERAWKRLSLAQHVEALTALVVWRAHWVADGRLQYAPHAATWLNGQRWTDELPDSWGASHASHIAATLPAKGERVVMPEHVKAAIAKLRAR